MIPIYALHTPLEINTLCTRGAAFVAPVSIPFVEAFFVARFPTAPVVHVSPKREVALHAVEGRVAPLAVGGAVLALHFHKTPKSSFWAAKAALVFVDVVGRLAFCALVFGRPCAFGAAETAYLAPC